MSRIGIKEVSALKFFQPACLCLGQLRVPGKFGLGEPFGKASLANTAYGSSRSVSMGGRDFRVEESWVSLPSKAWPDEALERGLPRPFAERSNNWRRASLKIGLKIFKILDRLKTRRGKGDD